MNSEEKQALDLAKWMAGDHSDPPPEEASVAIWVLKPEWSPEPSITIEQILEGVNRGVFASDTIEESSEDMEFVSRVFSNHSSQRDPQTSLEDVLSSIESGPFSRGDTSSDSANNNRWWSSSWFGAGIAVALVLIILVPNNFIAEKSNTDSRFSSVLELPKSDVEASQTPSQLMEEELEPLEENSEITVTKNEELPRTQSLKVEKTATLAPLDAPLEDSEMNPATAEISKSSISKLLGGNSETDPRSAGGVANLDAMMEQEGAETVSSSVYSKNEDDSEVYEAEMEVESTALAKEVAVIEELQQIEGRAQRSSRSFGSRQNRNQQELSEDLDASISGQELTMVVDLTTRETIQKTLKIGNDDWARNIPGVLAMCSSSKPTESLEILWFASQQTQIEQSIALLEYSAKYDHGDSQYLKRNWVQLIQLLNSNGQEVRAQIFQDLVDALP